MRTKFKVIAALAFLLTLAGSSASAFEPTSVVDRTGKVIIPSETQYIVELANGFFYLAEVNKDNPVELSRDGRIVDGDGKEIAINLPVGCKLSGVFLPEGDTTKSSKSLPPNTMLKISGARGFGLCTPGGKIVLEPEHGEIDYPINGRFPVLNGQHGEHTSLIFFVDAKTGMKYPVANNAVINSFTIHGALIPFAFDIDGAKTYGYLNTDGKVVIEPQFSRATEFDKTGMARVSVNGSHKVVFINQSGKIISPEFESASEFEDGYATVSTFNKGIKKMGLINRDFKFVLHPDRASLMRVFANQYAVQKGSEDKWQVISPQGKLLYALPPTTKLIYARGDAIFCSTSTPLPGETYFLVDDHGKILGSSNSDGPPCFQFGLAVVEKSVDGETQYELIDKTGRVLIPAQSSRLQILSADRILKYDEHD